MERVADAVVTVLATVGACTSLLGCGGQICRCHGDVCGDCSGTAPTAPAPDGGGSDFARGDSDVADATTDTFSHDASNENATGVIDVAAATDCCLDGPSPSDANSAQDTESANEGGPGCISGCSRGNLACAPSDPPVGWRCAGPGIDSSERFVEAGCTSFPINSVAWCCPSAFLSQCVCTPGQDWTCNDDPTISSLHGTCRPDGTCSCSIGPGLNPATGKCK
jgi:hypothetical protein